MAASQHILREYLLSLGFRIDERSNKTWDEAISKKEIRLGGLAKGAVAAAAAAQAMVITFARGMEQMYYSSRRIDTTVDKLQAARFGAKAIGLSADQMQSTLEGMARAIRSNPGLQGLIESFGIQVKGRTLDDVAVDLLATLRKMPDYVGQQFAALFGIDPDSYFQLTRYLDQYKEAVAQRKEMAAASGVDAEKAAEASREYMRMLRQITEQAGLLKDALAIALLPTAYEFAGVISEVLKDVTRITRELSSGNSDLKNRILEGLGMKSTGGGVELSAESRARLNNWIDKSGKRAGGKVTTEGAGSKGYPVSDALMGDPDAYLQWMEEMYGLPRGMLDRMWAKESARGKNKGPSKAGAMGDFQFMPKTAKQYGVDVNDFYSSAHGAARYMNNLLKKYGGDQQMALAAYNWGQGNLDRLGIGNAPAETRDYVKSISGQPIVIQLSQKTDIQVNSSDPSAAAGAVLTGQERVNQGLASVIRNQVGVIR